MKALVLLLALLFPFLALADTPRATYRVRSTGVVRQAGQKKTCGAATRMANAHHKIVSINGEFYINGMRWANLGGSSLPGEAYLAFHQGHKVWLTMWVYANDNKLVGLYSLNAPGCQDIVRLEGERL